LNTPGKNNSTREYIAQSANEHFQPLDALSKQDEPGAVAVMRRHLEQPHRAQPPSPDAGRRVVRIAQ
jgi:DNA-binding GntR family transcriptional regulator